MLIELGYRGYGRQGARALLALGVVAISFGLANADAQTTGAKSANTVEQPVDATAYEEKASRVFGEGGFFSITVENDIFSGTDRDYTNGLRLDYISEKNDLTAAGRYARRNLSWLSDAKDWYEVYALGQNMFTPSDITDPTPAHGQRPYAGFLYGSFGVSADRGDRLDTMAIDLGVVGDPSLAERSQKVVHDIIDADKPVGWDQQLEEEPGFRLLYERKYRYGYQLPFSVLGFGFDAAPHANVALGTIDTSAGMGLTVRFGQHLSDDYGPPRVRPAVAGPGFFNGDRLFSWYLFAGAEGRVTGRNIFLEGNTFGGVDGVTINRFGADLQLGAAVQLGPVEMSYTHVLRTEEYAAQDRFGGFGSVNIRADF